MQPKGFQIVAIEKCLFVFNASLLFHWTLMICGWLNPWMQDTWIWGSTVYLLQSRTWSLRGKFSVSYPLKCSQLKNQISCQDWFLSQTAVLKSFHSSLHCRRRRSSTALSFSSSYRWTQCEYARSCKGGFCPRFNSWYTVHRHPVSR